MTREEAHIKILDNLIPRLSLTVFASDYRDYVDLDFGKMIV